MPEPEALVLEARELATEHGIPAEIAAIARFDVRSDGSIQGWVATGDWARPIDADATGCPAGRIRIVGALADAIPVPQRERPYWPIGGGAYIAVLQAQVMIPSSNAEAVAVWRGRNDAESLTRFRPAKWTPADGTDAQSALRWLEGLTDDDPDRRALEEAMLTCRSWVRIHGRSIKDFGYRELAEMRCTGPDAAKMWMKRHRFNEQKIRQAYIERFGTRAH